MTLSLSDGKSEQISFVNWIVVIWSHCTFIHMIVGKSSKLPNDMLKALEDFSVIAKYKSLQNLFLNRHFPKCLNWNKEHPYFECMKFDRHTVKIKQIKMQRCTDGVASIQLCVICFQAGSLAQGLMWFKMPPSK